MSTAATTRYEVVIWWSKEDRVYVAEAPELPGCMAHGKSQAEALEQINEAIQLWIDTAREFGREIPAPRGHVVGV